MVQSAATTESIISKAKARVSVTERPQTPLAFIDKASCVARCGTAPSQGRWVTSARPSSRSQAAVSDDN